MQIILGRYEGVNVGYVRTYVRTYVRYQLRHHLNQLDLNSFIKYYDLIKYLRLNVALLIHVRNFFIVEDKAVLLLR